jgi:hypothetical protein
VTNHAAHVRGRRIPPTLRLGSSHWLIEAGWLATLGLLGAAYVAALADASRAILLAAAVLAATSTAAFGSRFGYQDDWQSLLKAALVGTVALTGCAEIAWVASLFIPTPGGSGGMLGLLTPFVLAVITGVAGMTALALLLAAGALLGRAIGLLR